MIEIEYFKLPIVDLSRRYLVRMKFLNKWTAWNVEVVTFPVTFTSDFSLENIFLEKYREILTNVLKHDNSNEMFNLIEPLLKDNYVKLIECELCQKKEPNEYMKELV